MNKLLFILSTIIFVGCSNKNVPSDVRNSRDKYIVMYYTDEWLNACNHGFIDSWRDNILYLRENGNISYVFWDRVMKYEIRERDEY